MEDIPYKPKTIRRNFQYLTIPDKMPSDILKVKKLSIGFDPNYLPKNLCLFYLEKVNVITNQ